MQSHSFYRDGRAIIVIARFISAAAAAACFGWFFLLVMASALRSAERSPTIRTFQGPGDGAKHELPGHIDGCDCPWCESELFRSPVPDDPAEDPLLHDLG
jgi:hypothetical protein